MGEEGIYSKMGACNTVKNTWNVDVLRTVASNILFLNISAFPHILCEETFYYICTMSVHISGFRPRFAAVILGLIKRKRGAARQFAARD